MKYRCWYLGHAWGRWEADLRQFSNFHHDYVDHFVRRWRYCERCGKKQNETYFVPGVSPSRLNYYDLIRDYKELAEAVVEWYERVPESDRTHEKVKWLPHKAWLAIATVKKLEGDCKGDAR